MTEVADIRATEDEGGRGATALVAGEGRESRTKRQRLAAELRRLRDLAGISGRDLAQRMQISQSKVSRIESGATLPSLPEVMAWADAVGMAETSEWLTALTEAAFTEVHTWRAALQRQPHLQGEIQEWEARAQTSRTFQPSVVPGLLQTAEYARRTFQMSPVPYAQADIAAAVAGRLERQLSLFRDDKRFNFLITEAALRWCPGPSKLMIPQLDRIASLSTLDNVSIGLIPHRGQALTFMSHSFVIYDHQNDDLDTFVEVETIHANLIINDPGDVALYENRWSLLSQMAILDGQVRQLLAALAAEFDKAGT